MKYVIGLEWTVEAMVGSSFGDVYPSTEGEIFLTIVSMVTGGIFYCKIFSDFSSLLKISQQTKMEIWEKQEQVYLFANKKQVSQKIYDKIQHFYNNFEDGQKIINYYSIIKELPTQLQQEVALDINGELISNVQIFNLGSPQFVLKMIKKLHPKVAVKDDYIIKIGEIAEEFYIISKGKVEMLGGDKKTVNRILESGSYFGEVGILLNQYRTCYVRAQTDCILMCIKKEDFLQLLNQFPQVKDFLKKVSQQRFATTNYENFSAQYLPQSSFKQENISQQHVQLKQNFFNSNQNNLLLQRRKKLPFIGLRQCDDSQSHIQNEQTEEIQNQQQQIQSSAEIIFTEESIHQSFDNQNLKRKIQKIQQRSDLKVLILNENILIFWVLILLTVLTYNLFYSIYSICFNDDFDSDLAIVFEVISFVTNLFDSILFSKLSTFSKKDNDFILNNKKIFFQYLNQELFFDVLSTVPFSNIYQLICGSLNVKNDTSLVRLLRFLRLIKFRRYCQYLIILQDQYKIQFKYNSFLTLAYLYFFMNHLNAGIMYRICKFEYDNADTSSLGFQMNNYSIQQEIPFMVKNVYVNFLYWSFCVSTQGAYGDIWAMTSIEKTYQDIANIIFKIYFCYLFAHVSLITEVKKSMLALHLEELDSLKQWSKLIGLYSNIKGRIRKFYNYKWMKQKGIEDNQIQDSLLPENIKEQIIKKGMRFIVELINPQDNPFQGGAITQFLKQFEKILVPRGEFVFQKGDLAQEMYFIEEGIIQIVKFNDDLKEEILGEIYKNSYFGGLEFINKVPTLRKVSVRAKTNACLYMLKMQSYIDIVQEYPFCKLFIENLFPFMNKKEKKILQDSLTQINVEESSQQNLSSYNKRKKSLQSQNIFLHNSSNVVDQSNDQQNILKRLNESQKRLKIKVIKQENLVVLNQHIIYKNNENSNQEILIYNEMIGSIIQTKLLYEKMYPLATQDQIKQQNNNQIQVVDGRNDCGGNNDENNNNNHQIESLTHLQSPQGNIFSRISTKSKIFQSTIAQLENQIEDLVQKNQLLQQQQNKKRVSLFQFDESNNNLQNHQKLPQIQKQQNVELCCFSNINSDVNLMDDSPQKQEYNQNTERRQSSNQQYLKSISSQYQQALHQQNNNQVNKQIAHFRRQSQDNSFLQSFSERYSNNLLKPILAGTADSLSQKVNLNDIRKKSSILLNLQDQFFFDYLSSQNILKTKQPFSSVPPSIDEFLLELDSQESNDSEEERIQSYFENNLEIKDDIIDIIQKDFKNVLFITEEDQDEILQMLNELTDNEYNSCHQNSDEKKQCMFYDNSEQEAKQYNCINTNKANQEFVQNIQEDILCNDNLEDIQISVLNQNISFSQLSFDLEEKIEQNKNKTYLKNALNILKILSQVEYQVSLDQYYFTLIIPLHIAFTTISFYNPILIIIEILVMLNEVRYLVKLIQSYKNTNQEISQLKVIQRVKEMNKLQEKIYLQKNLKRRKIKLAYIIFTQVLLLIPFSMIFDLIELEHRRDKYILIYLQLIRILPFQRLFNILSKLRKRNIYLCKVIETLIMYLLMCHVIGCILIVLGNIEPDFNGSWKIKVPAPQNNFPNNYRDKLEISNQSLYLQAVYWAYVTTSHVGVGDVTGVNLREKLYSILIMFLSTFTHIIFFGNFASMAKDAGFILKIKLDQKYERVIKAVRNINLTSFQIQVESYFNFIWNDCLGVDENQIVEKLPFSLKVDILKKRYKNCINKSSLFKLNSWQIDMNVVNSILRFMKVKIYLPNDIIAEAGRSYEDLYIFLQGKVEAFQFNGKKAYEGEIGYYFGGSLEKLPLTVYYQAKNICKVGVIEKQQMQYLQIVFPDWYQKLISRQKRNYSSQLLNLSFFQENIRNTKIIINSKNRMINYEISDKLKEHYEQIAANFFEIEISKDKQHDKLEDIQVFDQFNMTEEDLSESQQCNANGFNRQVTINEPQSPKENDVERFRRSRDINKTMIWNFQNVSVQKSQVTMSDYKIQKNQTYNQPFIICLPQKSKNQQSQGKSRVKDMIILHFSYIYKLVQIKDARYKYFLHPHSSASFILQIINLVFTLYSLIFTPIYACFGLQISTLPIFFEVLHTVYLCLQLFIDLRTPYFKQGVLVTNSKKIFVDQWKYKSLKLRMICILPFNIILWKINQNYQDISFILKLFLLLLRGIRTLQLFVLDEILLKISIQNKSKQKFLEILTSCIKFLLWWHQFSSIWIWYAYNVSLPNFPEYNWVQTNNLQEASLLEKILNCLFFVMSTATTCGYPSMKSNNDMERIFFILTIYFGNAIIAYGFGLIAEQSLLLPEKYQEINNKIKQFRLLLNDGQVEQVNKQIHKKIEHCYLYKLHSNLSVDQDLKQIQSLIPQTLYDQLYLSHQTKYLQKIPILLELTKSIRFRDIQKYIELKIFLPYDFINTKNSHNQNLYFVSKGSVNILSPKEDTVLKTLNEGEYFSSVTLNRYGKVYLCNTFTPNFAEVVQIRLKNIKQVFNTFPELKKTIQKKARKQTHIILSENEFQMNILTNFLEDEEEQINNYSKFRKISNKDNDLSQSRIQNEQNQNISEEQNSSSYENLKMKNFIKNIQSKSQKQRFNISLPNLCQVNHNQEKQFNNSQQNLQKENISTKIPSMSKKSFNDIKRDFLLEDEDGYIVTEYICTDERYSSSDCSSSSSNQSSIDSEDQSDFNQNLAIYKRKSYPTSKPMQYFKSKEATKDKQISSFKKYQIQKELKKEFKQVTQNQNDSLYQNKEQWQTSSYPKNIALFEQSIIKYYLLQVNLFIFFKLKYEKFLALKLKSNILRP
ncbi:cyclic nucleotide-binding domain protein (macronuclear) [Tetrahymena thermophila SB210]|uniref:Cyclic nucleotide-binding domain protein n=1 Tax=Tetrahymena thermophila (strain SB210) TaxID=312017 RepID=I7MJU6_TETTS|nr:cyclic nucleotide-binding domain protein [Tetrahymena thermophila SB210]EAS07213.2 cyclic nucleotide-binding domain protein [Tetrahymena thermophila SB210]|eukprot:XP_001027455.2 cyclic nucleotide-binding domain protein [Tetrahymena thermophila SB210]